MALQRRGRLVLLGVVVLVVVLGFGAWWFFIRDDSPPVASLRTRSTGTEAGGPASADGTWTVKADDPQQVFVGYRIQEVFAGDTLHTTAVGRTGKVTGSMTVHGSDISTATLSADMTDLTSDRVPRDQAIKTEGLETNKFPTATFTLSSPIRLAAPPVKGKVVQANASGRLTLHGVTKPVVVPVKARWNGTTIDVTGSAPITLADYGMVPISNAIVKIEDHGHLEFQLTYAK